MKKNKYLLILLGIVLIGVFLRFYSLGQVPGSLNWDEVSWGYNAYSISETGKDEYGKTLPLSFKAFGDYKQPMYVYLDSVFVKIMDLNSVSVRITSAVFGSLSIILVYFMVREIFSRRNYKEKLALLTALFFAISPWSIQFSRVAYEANVGLFFIILGVFLFFKGLNNGKIKYLFASVIPFALAGFTYHSLKVFTPVFFVFLLIYAFRFINIKKKILGLLLIFYVLINLVWVLDYRTTSRGRSVTFFLQPTAVLNSSILDLSHDVENKDFLGQVIHNRRVVYINKYVENYLLHFDSSYLFTRGDNPRHHAPGVGILYLVSLPFILLGIYFLIRNRITESLVIFGWLLLAPVASAMTIDPPNASRSLIFLPTWDIFFAAGYVLAEQIISKKYLTYFRIFFILILLLNFIYFTHQYFVHTNTRTQQDWQFGYKEAVEFASGIEKPKKVFFASDVEEGYIFYLFYDKYSPSEYIKEGGSERRKSKCYAIGNSYFGNCLDQIRVGDIYITTNKSEANFEKKKVKDIKYKDNSTAVTIYEAI